MILTWNMPKQKSLRVGILCLLAGPIFVAQASVQVDGVLGAGEYGAEIIVPSTYSRISNLVDLDNPKYEKFQDIAALPVTEVLDVEFED